MSIIHSLTAKRSARQWGVLCIGAFIYALLFSLGSQIEQYGSTALSRSLFRLFLGFPIALGALIVLFCAIDRLSIAARHETAAPPARRTLGTAASFAVLLIYYLPMFLIQYPGSFTYDIMPQSLQAAYSQFNTFHPLLHTLFLKACLSCAQWLDSFERAAALCSLLQLTIMAWCFAMVCASVRRCFTRRIACAVLLFFCLYPAHMAFASTYTKDAMFSSFFALFVALAFEEITRRHLSRFHWIVHVLSGVLACLLRNNMVYALAAWLVILLLSRKPLRRLALVTLSVFILARGAHAGLIALTHAESGPVREMLSIPAQQLARVRLYAGDTLTQQECEQMDALFNQVVYERYNPTIADPIKDRIREEAVTGDAIRLWLSLGKQHPGLYLDAFLHTALPSLYPYSEYRVSAQYIEVGECRIGLTQPYGLEQIQQPGRFAKVRQKLNEAIYSTGADHHPLFRWLFNTGLIFWLLLLQLLYDLYAGSMKRVAVMLLPVMLWGTYLLGPVMQGRYLYPFVCILPLFLLRGKAQAVSEPASR